MANIVSRLPTLFISHGGGPCFFMDWDPPDTWTRLGDSLRALTDQVGCTPRAVLWVSAHWETPQFGVTARPEPPLIFDYHGFPPHTYALRYPAPGAPLVAERVCDLLRGAGIAVTADDQRGFDHGLFIPALLSYPEARVPMLQLSLRGDLDPAAHLACGRALAPLRDEGVLILGSGYSYHNLRVFGPAAAPVAQAFDDALQAVVATSGRARSDRLARWHTLPAARDAHPREEHLMPLLVAAAAAEDEPGHCFFSAPVMGVPTSHFRFGQIASGSDGTRRVSGADVNR